MRITGGLYCGRQVKMPPGVLRPAMDRMRESMFAILSNIEGSSFLDLFSGSAIIGLEAASRGANPVVLVEKDRFKKDIIHQNMAIVAATCTISLKMSTVEQYIRGAREQFDYIHLDPPFPLPHKELLIKALSGTSLLKIGGTLTIHYPKEDRLATNIGNFRQYDLRTYGRSYLAFYQWNG